MRRALAISAVFVPFVLVAAAACVGEDATSPPPLGDSGAGGDTGAPPPPPPGQPPPPPSGDAGGDANGDADAAAWTPAVLDQAGSLALWLEASSSNLVISSGHVAVWHDRSRNANDATNSQAGPSVDTGATNGHDAVHFTQSGVTLGIADAPSMRFGTDQIFIAVVAKASASVTGAQTYFSKAMTMQSGAGPEYSAGLELYAAHVAGSVPTTNPAAHLDTTAGNGIDWMDAVDPATFHLVALRRPTAFSLTIAVDDLPAKSASTASIDISQMGVDARIGAVHYGNLLPTVDYDIAEIVIVHASNGIIADVDVANLHAYLKQKYAL